MTWKIETGDALDVMRAMPASSVDALVTDPPAGIGFMGKEWDGNKGGRDQWIAWLASVMRECRRILKPGAHGFVWAIPRTSHWTGMALEDAGFEVRDRVSHLFGTGFPKSLNVSKAIDAAAGAERPVIGKHPNPASTRRVETMGRPDHSGSGWQEEPMLTAPATEFAKLWNGWGTALKPACEDWWLIRRPLDSTVALNVQRHGTGALNIDACRLGERERTDYGLANASRSQGVAYGAPSADFDSSKGRWPANVTLDEAAAAILDEQSGNRQSGNRQSGVRKGMGYHGASGDGGPAIVGTNGGASRFFYVAKPAPGEREDGLDELPIKSGGEATGRKDGAAALNSPRTGAGRGGGRRNTHPTVKPIALMRWLCRLITPPGGIILDPFCGSGTTGIASVLEGFRFFGIEKSEEYVAIARARITARAS